MYRTAERVRCVGVTGFGRAGAAIAECLAESGFDVLVLEPDANVSFRELSVVVVESEQGYRVAVVPHAFGPTEGSRYLDEAVGNFWKVLVRQAAVVDGFPQDFIAGFLVRFASCMESNGDQFRPTVA